VLSNKISDLPKRRGNTVDDYHQAPGVVRSKEKVRMRNDVTRPTGSQTYISVRQTEQAPRFEKKKP